MTPQKQQEIIQAIAAKCGTGRPCPICGHTQKSVVDRVVGLALDDGGQFNVPGPMLKCALVQCTNCGFVALHNSAALGIEL